MITLLGLAHPIAPAVSCHDLEFVGKVFDSTVQRSIPFCINITSLRRLNVTVQNPKIPLSGMFGARYGWCYDLDPRETVFLRGFSRLEHGSAVRDAIGTRMDKISGCGFLLEIVATIKHGTIEAYLRKIANDLENPHNYILPHRGQPLWRGHPARR